MLTVSEKNICNGYIDAVTTHFLRKYSLFSFSYPFSLLKKYLFLDDRTEGENKAIYLVKIKSHSSE